MWASANSFMNSNPTCDLETSESMKKPSGLNEKPFPRFNYPENSNLPVESDLVETKLISSWLAIGLFPVIELRAELSSNLLALVLENTHEPPS